MERLLLSGGNPNTHPFQNAKLDYYFGEGKYFGGGPSSITVTRGGTAMAPTDLHPSVCKQDMPYTRYNQGVIRIRAHYGLLRESGPTINYLPSSATPTSQTTKTLTTGTIYAFWLCGGDGTTSATLTNGTTTSGCTGTATPGNYINVTVTGTSPTCVVTLSGTTPYVYQFENVTTNYPAPTSFIWTAAGSTATRGEETLTQAAPTVSANGYALFASGYAPAPDGLHGVMEIFGLSDGTASQRVELFQRGAVGGPNQARLVNSSGGGASSNDIGGPVWNYQTFGKLMGSTAPCNQAFSFNGGPIYIGSGGPIACTNGQDVLPTVAPTTITWGNNGPGTTPWGGFIVRTAIFDKGPESPTSIRFKTGPP